MTVVIIMVNKNILFVTLLGIMVILMVTVSVINCYGRYSGYSLLWSLLGLFVIVYGHFYGYCYGHYYGYGHCYGYGHDGHNNGH